MGLASALRTFTKVLKPVLASLRGQGIKCMAYLDDLLVLAESLEICSSHVAETCAVLTSLGFVINQTKSQLIPSQSLKYLGFFINSATMQVTLPVDKIIKVIRNCIMLLTQGRVSIQALAEFLGLILAYTEASDVGALHHRSLEWQKLAALAASKGSYSATLVLSANSRQEIRWWHDNAPTVSRQIEKENPSLVVCTDASLQGGCAKNRITGQTTRGTWSEEDDTWHINAKELKAALLGIQSLCQQERNSHIQLRSDNVTTVAYIKKKGGQKISPLRSHRQRFVELVY